MPDMPRPKLHDFLEALSVKLRNDPGKAADISEVLDDVIKLTRHENGLNDAEQMKLNSAIDALGMI